MLKKILIGGLVAVVVVAVAFSIYNTTLAARGVQDAQSSTLSTAQGAGQAAGNGYGQGAQVAAPDAAPDTILDVVQDAVLGAVQGTTQSAVQGAQGNGQGGQGNGSGAQSHGSQNAAGDQTGVPNPQPQNGFTEWVSFSGTVSGYAAPRFTLLTDDGQSIPAEVGNISYITELGLALQDGDRVSVIGFWDANGGLALKSLTLEASGETFSFRDDLGRPLWSGGRGQGGPSKP